MKKERQSNFELLRIISMFMVLILHADFWAIGGPTAEEITGTPASSVTRVVLEAMAICSVNVFVMISGWFGIRSSLKGFCNFVFQCLYFLVGIYAVMLLTGHADFTIEGVRGCLVLTSKNWFILNSAT